MDLLTSLKISSSGLTANKKRMQAISSNIANAQVTRTAEGGPYKPKEVVFGSEPARESFAEILEGELEEKAQAVHAVEVTPSKKPPILKYDPSHPDANAEGYVAYPNINVMEEMANLYLPM
jgi:flagellar basal-body rod protein FlgC